MISNLTPAALARCCNLDFFPSYGRSICLAESRISLSESGTFLKAFTSSPHFRHIISIALKCANNRSLDDTLLSATWRDCKAGGSGNNPMSMKGRKGKHKLVKRVKWSGLMESNCVGIEVTPVSTSVSRELRSGSMVHLTSTNE